MEGGDKIREIGQLCGNSIDSKIWRRSGVFWTALLLLLMVTKNIYQYWGFTGHIYPLNTDQIYICTQFQYLQDILSLVPSTSSRSHVKEKASRDICVFSMWERRFTRPFSALYVSTCFLLVSISKIITNIILPLPTSAYYNTFNSLVI